MLNKMVKANTTCFRGSTKLRGKILALLKSHKLLAQISIGLIAWFIYLFRTHKTISMEGFNWNNVSSILNQSTLGFLPTKGSVIIISNFYKLITPKPILINIDNVFLFSTYLATSYSSLTYLRFNPHCQRH